MIVTQDVAQFAKAKYRGISITNVLILLILTSLCQVPFNHKLNSNASIIIRLDSIVNLYKSSTKLVLIGTNIFNHTS